MYVYMYVCNIRSLSKMNAQLFISLLYITGVLCIFILLVGWYRGLYLLALIFIKIKLSRQKNRQ